MDNPEINTGLETSPAKYWNERYKNGHTGWDIGHASQPLIHIIDKVWDKNISILIPGAGNAYEALYLAENNFTNITVIDIAEVLIEKLRERFSPHPNIKLIHGDFFEHEGAYDLILEQTFFCALLPKLRKNYVGKMHSLLQPNGVLSGVLFNKNFDGGPPFGGNKGEYLSLFLQQFTSAQMEDSHISIAPRAGTEVIFSCRK